MKTRLKYGTGSLPLDTRDAEVIAVLNPGADPAGKSEEEIIRNALQHPVGTPRLSRMVHAGQKAVIVTSDITRPFPTERVLPAVTEELGKGGIRKEDILVLFAVGSHRHMTEEERAAHLGMEIAAADSSQDRMKYLGTTSRGTPVEIDERAADADILVCLGNVEYHYFAGFSGGAKAVVPGCASRRTITCNHRWMLDPHACAGMLEGNPVREDLEEAAGMADISFIVNCVMNTKKEIVSCFCGEVTQAHRMACTALSEVYACPVPERADIVVVSQGGSPKDASLYQAQKALANAVHAVRQDGIIILTASCEEGFGEETFASWLCSYDDPDRMFAALQKDFVLGAHKAVSIAMARKRASLFLVSEMKQSAGTFFRSFSSLQQAYDCACDGIDSPKVILMPFGGSTFPAVCGERKK